MKNHMGRIVKWYHKGLMSLYLQFESGYVHLQFFEYLNIQKI